MKNGIAVVIPNWNGADSIEHCLTSLQNQSQTVSTIVVDNGSSDESVALIQDKFPDVVLLQQTKNLGFAGGVNVGLRYAIDHGAKFIALFNNDAVADKKWLEKLVSTMQSDDSLGIVTGKLLDAQGKKYDSTGDCYTVWGLPFPRGRSEPVSDKYDKETDIFAASGGASLYRLDMLKQIGLFDEAFFAYYEDIDISFRAQLYGWKVMYEPSAVAYHQIGATSSKIKGFTTYQTMKNLPILVRKNLPLKLAPRVMPRFFLAYVSFFASATVRGQFWPAFKGAVMSTYYIPHTLSARWKIQKNRQVSLDYINKMLVHDLPPNATKLRALRAKWWQLSRKAKN